MTHRIALAAACMALCGCAGTQAIRPVAATDVSLVCIKTNPRSPAPDLVAEIRTQLAGRGIRSLTYDVKAPPECRYRMLYRVGREWDLAPYVAFADLEVYDGAARIGHASYDARARGLGLQRYKPASEKIGALVDDLFPSRARR